MIVEDDPMVVAINERFLSKVEGFDYVGSSDNLESAKGEILRHEPELILLDVFFPNGKGTDLLKWIRFEEIKADVILITADRSTSTVSESFRFGVVDYLIKPFKFERFREALTDYKNHKMKIQSVSQINQRMLDEITKNLKGASAIELDLSAIVDEAEYNNPTFDSILAFVKENYQATFTAQHVAEVLGVSRITARRYLDYLEKHKVLELELEYGTVGRPKNVYKINEKFIDREV